MTEGFFSLSISQFSLTHSTTFRKIHSNFMKINFFGGIHCRESERGSGGRRSGRQIIPSGGRSRRRRRTTSRPGCRFPAGIQFQVQTVYLTAAAAASTLCDFAEEKMHEKQEEMAGIFEEEKFAQKCDFFPPRANETKKCAYTMY